MRNRERRSGTLFFLPERRSGSKTFTGTPFRTVPAPLQHCTLHNTHTYIQGPICLRNQWGGKFAVSGTMGRKFGIPGWDTSFRPVRRNAWTTDQETSPLPSTNRALPTSTSYIHILHSYVYCILLTVSLSRHVFHPAGQIPPFLNFVPG